MINDGLCVMSALTCKRCNAHSTLLIELGCKMAVALKTLLRLIKMRLLVFLLRWLMWLGTQLIDRYETVIFREEDQDINICYVMS